MGRVLCNLTVGIQRMNWRSDFSTSQHKCVACPSRYRVLRSEIYLLVIAINLEVGSPERKHNCVCALLI